MTSLRCRLGVHKWGWFVGGGGDWISGRGAHCLRCGKELADPPFLCRHNIHPAWRWVDGRRTCTGCGHVLEDAAEL